MTGTSAPAPLEALRELRSQVVAERACFQSLHPVSLGEDPGVGLLSPLLTYPLLAGLADVLQLLLLVLAVLLMHLLHPHNL